jgi:ATP-dependent RNA helicase HelY
VGVTYDKLVDEFEATYDFQFDDYQRRGCTALARGDSALVAAPTGAGKTVVGEFAAWLALRRTGRTFYTTPIKALSNQKFGDFVGIHGAHNVGLLTGDNSINGDAPIVVMTTEVLRNMIYEDAPGLDSLHYVVLDEVHYLQDPYRGAVWEEVLIHLPPDVQTASLSATVSNAEEFAEWLKTLRGHTEVIIEEKRPVEIRHWYFVSDELLPMFVRNPSGDVVPNPRVREFERRRGRGRPGRSGRRWAAPRARIPRRTEVIDRLDSEKLLPAIYFIFSRRGCDDAVKQCLMDNVRLTSPEERRIILEQAEDRTADIPTDELEVLGYSDWLSGLLEGVAPHHAGMVPPFKETVEELFKQGYIKVVFATETLALGINMPARTVTIENLTKFTGEKHELMTPGQYTQLSGRAGRRGIDELGHSVVLYQRFTPYDTITRLATTRTYPLRSSFQISYNMAVNLVRTYDREDAEHLVNSSFAQFQADRDVVQLERTRERSEAYLASYRERMHCDLGDFDEYRDLLDKLNRAEERSSGSTRATQIREAVSELRPGDVISVTGGKRRGLWAVLEIGQRKSERAPRVLAMSDDRTMVRFSPADFQRPPRPVGRLDLPDGFEVRDPRMRRHLARKLERIEPREIPRRAEKVPKEIRIMRRRVEGHPCHSCPDLGRHLHYAERGRRLEKEVASVDRRIRRRTGTLARRFDQVLDLLGEMECVSGWSLTPRGELLTRIYNECDLLVVEALGRHVFDGLDGPEIAAVCSALVYETRGPEPPPVAPLPTAPGRNALQALMRLWGEIKAEEDVRSLDLTREPDPGYAEKAYRWAAGAPLEDVLGEDDPPGDFVRTIKQLVDLLRQMEEVAPDDDLARTIGRAIEGLHRGVVAYSSLEV